MFVERSIIVTVHLQAPLAVHRLLTPPGLHPSLKFQMLSLLSLLPLASISAPGGSSIISKSIQLEVLRRSYKLERNLTTVDDFSGRIRLVKEREKFGLLRNISHLELDRPRKACSLRIRFPIIYINVSDLVGL